MKLALASLSMLFVSVTASATTYPCMAEAVQAAETAYNNAYKAVSCVGDGKAIELDPETQTYMIAVRSLGPNQIGCSDKGYDVKIREAGKACEIVSVDLLGPIN